MWGLVPKARELSELSIKGGEQVRIWVCGDISFDLPGGGYLSL